MDGFCVRLSRLGTQCLLRAALYLLYCIVLYCVVCCVEALCVVCPRDNGSECCVPPSISWSPDSILTVSCYSPGTANSNRYVALLLVLLYCYCCCYLFTAPCLFSFFFFYLILYLLPLTEFNLFDGSLKNVCISILLFCFKKSNIFLHY